MLDEDEDQRRQRLAAEQRRLHEGIRGEAAERFHLVLDHGGNFAGLDVLEIARRETQDAIDEFVADAPQQPLAKAALVGVDEILEQAVDDDEHEERQAEGEQRGHALQRQAREKLDMAEERQVEGDRHEELGVAGAARIPSPGSGR